MINKIQDQPKEYLTYKNNYLGFLNPDGQVHSIEPLVKKYEGPFYIYNLEFIRYRAQLMQSALKGVKLFYALKANPHLDVIKTLNSEGVGADVVSIGEVRRALEAGIPAHQIVYSGVGKTKFEIETALELNIYQLNVESLPELKRIIEIAKIKNKKATVAFRLNPNISIETHPYIATGLRDNKFGIDLDLFPELLELCKLNQNCLNIAGISLHLGSQMLEFSSLSESIQKLKPYFLELNQNFNTCYKFDIGGGLGIYYQTQDLISENKKLQEYADIIQKEMNSLRQQVPNLEVQSEPGRWLVAHGGVLVTEVQYVKQTPFKEFMVVDSGMNHLIRPSLYEAYHEIFPLKSNSSSKKTYDVVGPICESSDFFAKERTLSEVKEGDFIVIADCGAYAASMASDYNLQPKAKEVCF